MIGAAGAAWMEAFEVIWMNEREARVGGVPMRYVDRDYHLHKTSADEIIVLKTKSYFDTYRALAGREPECVLELGVFEGGSAFAFAGLWPSAKIVGVDWGAANPWIGTHLRALGLEQRVRLHHGVSQDDEVALARIVAEDLGGRIDVVVDDASHLYEPSRRSFELLFPHLSPGGLYVIEDWAWAHRREREHDPYFVGRAALSNLVFELTMLAGSRTDLVESIEINRRFVALRRAATNAPLTAPMKLEETYFLRGKALDLI